MDREYKNRIEIADYESKKESITAYLVEEKATGNINLFIPPLKGRAAKDDAPALIFALTEDRTTFTIKPQPTTMLEVLAGEKEPPRNDFFELVEVTPVKISKDYHVSLTITAPDLLLIGPANYLMVLLKEKRKATEDEINERSHYDGMAMIDVHTE
jgi:hypothetical protein